MKNLLLVASVVAFLGKLQGDAINVTSADFRIWGDFTEDVAIPANYPSEEIYESVYSYSGSFMHVGDGLGLDKSFTTPGGSSTAATSLNTFGLSMQARVPQNQAWIPEIGEATATINLFATATSRLTVGSDGLTILVSSIGNYNYNPDEQDMTVQLRDLTSGVELLSLSGLAGYTGFMSGRESTFHHVSTNPLHEYELTVSGWIVAFDGKSANINTEVQLISSSSIPPHELPENGNTVLLLATALVVLTLPLQKKKGSTRPLSLPKCLITE